MRAARAGAGAARRAFALAGARTGPPRRARTPRGLCPPETATTDGWATAPPDRATTRWVCPARGSNRPTSRGRVAACAGGAHTVLVGADDAVYTCGLNDFGRSALPGASHAAVPKRWRASPVRPGAPAAAGTSIRCASRATARSGRSGGTTARSAARARGPGRRRRRRRRRVAGVALAGGAGRDDRGPVTNIAAGRGAASRSRRTALFSRGARVRGVPGRSPPERVSTLRNRPSCERRTTRWRASP